jgi:hypothetical protein
MPRAATRQPDLFGPSDQRADQPATLPVFPVLTAEQQAEALALLERELAEVEASPDLPCRHDTSRAMGKEMSFRGRLWQVQPQDQARLLARWNTAWERHWAKWEAETPPEPEIDQDRTSAAHA